MQENLPFILASRDAELGGPVGSPDISNKCNHGGLWLKLGTSERLRNRTVRRQSMPPGMTLRGRVYHADFMKNGRRVRKRLSTDLDAAKEILNALRFRADKASFDLLDNRYPWSELRRDFLAWAQQNVRRWAEYEADLVKFEEFCNIRCVSMVTPSLLLQFRSWRIRQGVTPRTINRQVGTIHNMLAKGVRVFRCIASNPLTEFQRLPEGDPTKKRRALTADEIVDIFKYAPADLKPVLRMYATTGMRCAEVVTLRFDDIDWENQSLTVRASVAKGKRAREIPLDDETMKMLRQLRQQATVRPEGFNREFVFINRIGNPHSNTLLERFYVVCKHAGIKDAVPGGSVDLHCAANHIHIAEH